MMNKEKQMRIFTTLLVLLLSSPVFAETWVCSEVRRNSYIQQITYRRSGDHFMWKNVRNRDEEKATIAYEDEKVLILFSVHPELSLFYPMMIDKETGSFRSYVLAVEQSHPEHYGSCVEVE
jgi:hypothetical protein